MTAPVRSKTMESIRSLGEKAKNLKIRPAPIIIPKVLPPRPSRAPRKKALVIGVQEVSGQTKLDGPHKDVDSMVELLIEKFEYKPEDIVILVDKPDHLKRPTRMNILKEMYNLVRDVVADDRLFFYYAGHACQQDCQDKTEEDGMDECIYPCDWNPELPERAPLINDNLLKKILVDKLPPGSYLTAIFDSCHSATLLDLPHYNCNRVYFPWVSKGNEKRKTTIKVDPDFPKDHAENDFNVNTRVIFQATRMNGQLVKARKTSLAWKDDADTWFPREPTRAYTAPPEKIKRVLATEARKKRRQYRTHVVSTYDGFNSNSFADREETIVESPTGFGEVEPTYCEGFECKVLGTGSPKAHVISLSACQDEQISWEDKDGKSMTQTLVEILRDDPHPTLQDFMFKLGYQIHSRLVRIHDESKRFLNDEEAYKKRMAQKNKKPKPRDPNVQLETQNWQDPQLSSQNRLDMTAPLRL